MSRTHHLRITRHRRAFAIAASAAIALAVFLSGVVALSQTPGLFPPVPGVSGEAATGPAEVSPDLRGAWGDDQRDPADGGDTPDDSTGGGTTAGEFEPGDSSSSTDHSWFDEATGEAEILVRFDDLGVDPEARGNTEAAVASLQRNTNAALDRAGPRLSALETSGAVEVLNEFWLVTAVLVKGVPTEETLAALSTLPGATDVIPNYEAASLDMEDPIEVDDPSEETEYTDNDGTPITYGLDHIDAPDAWDEYGARGQGVRVAVLDTGVDPTHPDLATRLATEDPHDPLYPGGWIHLDHNGNAQAKRPADPATHGTHVAGTVLGGDASGTRIGVAPEAELMAVNAISDGSSSAKIMKALEWALAPYDAEGDPAGRSADVVNMSLGYTDRTFTQTFLLPGVKNIRDAGVFPAVASGNDMEEGSECISNPSSSHDAFAVGMTDEERQVNPHSCGGTTNWPEETVNDFEWPSGQFVKPDAAAPGTDVISAVPGGGWGKSTGTSMATPHVAGAVAALRSAQPGLTVDQIAESLELTAWHPEREGGGAPAPDIRYGHGLIDLHDAIAMVRGDSGFEATITDADTNAPLSGVTVGWSDLDSDDPDRQNPDRGEVWASDADGKVGSYLSPGHYELHFERFGYETATREVTVPAIGFVEFEVQLDALTTGVVEGSVTHADTGAALPGVSVSLVGQDLITTTAEDGTYRLDDVPVGEHRFRAAVEEMHTVTSEPAGVLAAEDRPTTVDFEMSDLPNVLVLGDTTGRSAELADTQDLVVDSERNVPADLNVLAEYDSVVWDAPGEISPEALQRAIDITDAAGTGIVWLDLGSSDASGIAMLHRHRADPAERTAGPDGGALATGYSISATQPDHPIFDSGDLFTGSLISGSQIWQDERSSSDKFWASFDELQSETVQVLAQTVAMVESEDGERQWPDPKGPGIAVDERDGNRHALLALHGTHAAVDARSWSAQGKQVFVNAIDWVAGSEKNDPPKQPPPENPDPPVIPPGDGGDRGSGSDGGDRPGSAPPGAGPGAAPAQQQLGGGDSSGGGSSQAPASQATPKPEFEPDPPVAGENQLTAQNAGGVTVRVEDDIAHITTPGAEPGDWFFLHVYPSTTAVDWIRVNDEGELRVDVSTLNDGVYKFAFTDTDEEFVGWVEVQIGAGAAGQADTAGLTDAATLIPDVGSGGFELSTAELLMLLGAALLLLTAAGVVLLGLRKPVTPGAVPAGAAA